jgi:DNA polymerase-3 subunit alpha
MAVRFRGEAPREEKGRLPHPRLQEILSDTYGVIVYQEQVMEIGKALAGFTMGQADVLRKAMGRRTTP